MAERQLREGDKVRYKLEWIGRVDGGREGIATVTLADDAPIGIQSVALQFDDVATEMAVDASKLELVAGFGNRGGPRPKAYGFGLPEMAGNANPGETPLTLRTSHSDGRMHQSAFEVGERVYVTGGLNAGIFGTIRVLHGSPPSGTVAAVTILSEWGDERGPIDIADLAREPRRGVPGIASGLVEPLNPDTAQPPLFNLGSSELGSDDVLGDDTPTSDSTSNARGTAPAADRIVSINHNSAEVQEVKASLDALIDGVRGDNHLTANADEKLAYISELQDLRRAMEGPTIRVRRMYAAVYSNGVIRWLCDKAGGTIVGTLATTAAAAILKWLGVL